MGHTTCELTNHHRHTTPTRPYKSRHSRLHQPCTTTASLWDILMHLQDYTGQPKRSRRLHSISIEEEIAEDLRCCRCKITVIADDSGSMKSPSYVEGMPHITTRWQELQHTLARLLDMLLFLDQDGGFELYFL